MVYKNVGCGGTFDHLHVGHKAFLRFAFSQGRHVLIGLTSDAYIAQYKPYQQIQSFTQRKEQLEAFLSEENLISRCTIAPINTPFGPAVDSSTFIEALVVTEETKNGAKEINEEREKKGLPVLPLLVMPLIHKHGVRISSTQIRKGHIDQEGNLYSEEFQNCLLLLPEDVRDKLRVPFGSVYTNIEEAVQGIDMQKCVVVGDATTVVFHGQNLYPKIAIVDYIIQRKKAFFSLNEEGFTDKRKELHAINPPGTITPSLWHALQEALFYKEGESVIIVEGEEDLAVLPVVLLLPLGWNVFYGQPDTGLVRVFVTPEIKDAVKRLLGQFNRA